jgi:hypothetical protein
VGILGSPIRWCGDERADQRGGGSLLGGEGYGRSGRRRRRGRWPETVAEEANGRGRVRGEKETEGSG